MKRWILKVTICSVFLVGAVLAYWLPEPQNSNKATEGLLLIGDGLLIALSPFAAVYLLILLGKKPKT